MIKECPLCGSPDVAVHYSYASLEYFGRCLKCGCRGGTHKTREEAIAAWNARPSEEELLAALKEVVREFGSEHYNPEVNMLEIHMEKAKELLKKYEVEG